MLAPEACAYSALEVASWALPAQIAAAIAGCCPRQLVRVVFALERLQREQGGRLKTVTASSSLAEQFNVLQAIQRKQLLDAETYVGIRGTSRRSIQQLG